MGLETDIASKGVAPLLRLITGRIPFLFASIKNYLTRPKIKCSFEYRGFEFETTNKIPVQFPFLCLIIESHNDEDLKIKLNSIEVAISNFYNFASVNPVFGRCLPNIAENMRLNCLKKNSVINLVLENWADFAADKLPPYTLPAHDKIIIPIYFYQNEHWLVDKPKDSKLWFSDKKISVRFNVNSKNAEYGINRIKAYEKALTWLAYWDINKAKNVIAN